MTLTLELKTSRRVEQDPDTKRFFAFNDALHVIAEGDTRAEAEANFEKAVSGLVEYCFSEGLPLPKALGRVRSLATA